MSWDKIKPTDDELLINFPGQCRANWEAIELGTDSALLITNAKCASDMALVDTKLAQITTAGKVSGTALTLLANIPAVAGNIPATNLGNALLASNLDTDGTLAANSDAKIPSQKATKTYVDSKILGAWVDKTSSYGAQQAATDGFVVVYKQYMTNLGNDAIAVYTDSNANPTILRAAISSVGGTTSNTDSVMVPVRKSDYWKVVCTGTTPTTVYWIPLGS
jgi:hypothetical protein